VKRTSALAVVAAVALSTAFASEASAQPAVRDVAAEDLFRQGRELLEQKRYAEACEKLAASQKLDPAVGTLFSLGACYEGAGRLASAWFAYREAASLSAQRGDRRRADAQGRADALEPRLAHIAVRLHDAGSDVKVTLDGEPIVSEALPTPLPVDVGAHRLEVRGDEAYSVTVEVKDNAATATVVVPTLVHPKTPPAPEMERVGAWKHTLGLGLVAAGGVAITAGAILGMQAIVKGRDVHAACPSGATCSDHGAVQSNGTAETFADAATVLLPAGAVAVLGGGFLLLQKIELRPVVTERSARLHASFAW
jgi:hypothetical protein